MMVWVQMMVINCPQYDNMQYCISMIQDLPVYMADYSSLNFDRNL